MGVSRRRLKNLGASLAVAAGLSAGATLALVAPIAPAAPVDDSLAKAARDAAALLASHQQPPGYWLTAHTVPPRFTGALHEMNTFLTAMLIDLLAPLPAADGLRDSVEKARVHLAAQIEASGLVRYHGLPDAATIPALGCAITPDADDTALAWRIAGSLRPAAGARAADALAVLRRYRTAGGLYRTWLAPRERFQCIDPGRDPNPPDGGIQMHILLWLRQADPAAAGELCIALRRALADPGLWVYYQEAPLIPWLRAADLKGAGCALELPAGRRRTPLPHQEVWMEAAMLLTRLQDGDGTAAPRARVLLRDLAANGFASLRSEPPLLYHNDLTAHTSRFYWSEDFGYGLWLRLYRESQRNPSGSAGSGAGGGIGGGGDGGGGAVVR